MCCGSFQTSAVPQVRQDSRPFMNPRLDSYQVVEGEQASVLSQQVRAKLSSTQRQEDARQRVTVLRLDLQQKD